MTRPVDSCASACGPCEDVHAACGVCEHLASGELVLVEDCTDISALAADEDQRSSRRPALAADEHQRSSRRPLELLLRPERLRAKARETEARLRLNHEPSFVSPPVE